jgi:holin-like protein
MRSTTADRSNHHDQSRQKGGSDIWIGLTFFVACNLMGLFLAAHLSWRIPGPVWGLLLLWSFLTVRRKTSDFLADASAVFLRYLPVIILPAGVGVMRLPMDRHWWFFVAACLLSWLAALWLSAKLGAWVFGRVSRLQELAP